MDWEHEDVPILIPHDEVVGERKKIQAGKYWSRTSTQSAMIAEQAMKEGRNWRCCKKMKKHRNGEAGCVVVAPNKRDCRSQYWEGTTDPSR